MHIFVTDCLLVLETFQVLVEGRAKSRAAILNRPFALNSLTASMVKFFVFNFEVHAFELLTLTPCGNLLNKLKVFLPFIGISVEEIV